MATPTSRNARSNRLVTLLFALAYLTAAISTFAAPPSSDWNRFRGPNGSGIAPAANTPAKFTEADFNWKIELPGIGHSSPVISGNRIFLTCGDKETAKRYLICVDLDSGKTLWKKEYDSHTFGQHKDNSYASASPTADDERVYFTFMSPESYKVYCLDFSGNQVWTYDMGPWKSQHGGGCSPITFEGTLIVPNDQDGPTASLVALDARTGKPKWKTPRTPGNTAASTPCIFQPKGGPAQIILTSTASGISDIDLATGKQNWIIADALKLRSVASPIATDTICAGTCGEGAKNRAGIVLQPNPAAPANAPKLLHKLPTGNDYSYVPTPVIMGDLMFLWADAATVTCVKTATGQQVWQQKIPALEGRLEFYASPIIAGDKLYNISKTGEVICLKAGDQFELLGRSPLNEMCYATPAVAGNRLIIRTASHLVSVGVK